MANHFARSVSRRRERRFRGAATPLSVREAAQQPARGAFRFHDAVVRADYAVSEPITNQRGATISTIHVAPLVPADWTPNDPVTFWAVAELSRRSADAAQWATAHNAALRIGGFQLPVYRQAAERAAALHGVPSAPDAVFVHWLADPAVELAAARLRVALQIAGVIAVWLLAIAGWRSFVRQVGYTL